MIMAESESEWKCWVASNFGRPLAAVAGEQKSLCQALVINLYSLNIFLKRTEHDHMNFAKVELMADLSLLHWQWIVQVYLIM